MKITRRYTASIVNDSVSVYDLFKWERRSSVITDPDGTVVFRMDGVEVPSGWGQIAVDILASKYLRKAGVPVRNQDRDYLDPASRDATMDGEDGYAKMRGSNNVTFCQTERSMKQVAHRLALCWRTVGEKYGYFDTPDDAQAFYDEIVFMLLAQMAAPNSPQWFNAGLFHAYGITGPSQGHFIPDPATGQVSEAPNAYEFPQVHACYINRVDDTLLRPGGIFDFVTREARLFKYGSGSGANLSNLRASNEPLSSGGLSSGLMSWLKIADTSAGAIKSGGTTRRAAKMVVLNADHPNILDFVRLKAREEVKVAAMVEGMRHLSPDEKAYADKTNLRLTFDFNGEAYQTVTGQNANNSVRVTDEFMRKVVGQNPDSSWNLTRRTDGKVTKTIDAKQIMSEIAEAAWRCADPGMQFDTTYNDWHTCPAGGRINGTNPCSEYAFLDNTACNLASLNVVKFFDDRSRAFDIESFQHATHLWTIVLEISVLMASYPAAEIAALSWKYRTLGLGYANMGALLMRMGLAYDSAYGVSVCAAITSLLTGQSYITSAMLANEHGPFDGFAENREAMLGVIRNHAIAAGASWKCATERPVSIRPPSIDHDTLRRIGPRAISNAAALSDASRSVWRNAYDLGSQHGFRNAQTTVLAPTGTIGLLMECDTTGVEPDFALVKFKKLSGGGMMRIVNESVVPALYVMGMSDAQIKDVLEYINGSGSLAVEIDGETLESRLRRHRVSDSRISEIKSLLGSTYHVKFAIPELESMGFSTDEIEEIDAKVCGHKTVEGAPHLPVECYHVFDCASPGGSFGKRCISWMGHLRMMAAAQSFISGSISKTINMPNDATVADVEAAYIAGWGMGIKALALYRDGSKRSQPLNTSMSAESSSSADASALRAQLDSIHEVVLGRAASDDRGRLALTTETVTFVRDAIAKTGRRRRRLPDDASAIRHKFVVGNTKGYVNVTLYEDGTPGEIFIQCSKAGSTLAGFTDVWAIAVSNMLQYGVPIEVIVRKFAYVSFAPHGMTANQDIPFAKSLVDYIARWLGSRFVPGYAQQPAAHGDSVPVEASPAMTPRSHVSALPTAPAVKPAPAVVVSHNPQSVVAASMAAMRGEDAQPCDECGMLMVNAGGCWKCTSCGAGGSCG